MSTENKYLTNRTTWNTHSHNVTRKGIIMARVEMVEKTFYQFNELSDSAKDNAIAKYACNHDWWDSVYSDFIEILTILGFDVESDKIEFSGFYHQGSYAAFSGSYRHNKGTVQGIKDYAPKDEELHRIAKELVDMQRKCFYALSSEFRYSNYHGYSIDMEDNRRQYGWVDPNCDAESVFRQVVKDLSKWLYNALESEYENLTSYETFAEDAEANGWEFDETGNII